MVGKIFSFCVEPYLLPFELELDRLEEIFPNAVAKRSAHRLNLESSSHFQFVYLLFLLEPVTNYFVYLLRIS
jgi:hypothetical protein